MALAGAGDIRDKGSIPGSGRSPGGGHGNPLQYFLPGESRGQRSLASYSPWRCTESGTTEATQCITRKCDVYVHQCI